MIVVRQPPPNLAAIIRVFPGAAGKGIIFAYGGKIYNPTNAQLSKQILAHEAVHGERQLSHPGGPDAWWAAYLTHPKFVFAEELPAHIAEYKAYKGGRHGFSRQGALHHVAGKLSGPLYNHAVTKTEAIKLLLEGADG